MKNKLKVDRLEFVIEVLEEQFERVPCGIDEDNEQETIEALAYGIECLKDKIKELN